MSLPTNHTPPTTQRRFGLVAALVTLAVVAAACSTSNDDTGSETPTTAPPEATAAPTPAPPAPTTAAPGPLASPELSACEEYFVTLDALSGEFLALVDEGNRSLLLTIGQETPYDEGAAQLDQVATRLHEIVGEIGALGDPPATLEARVEATIASIEQFAEGYREASGAAAVPDVIALNRSLTTVSYGTGLLQNASQTVARC